MELTSLHILLTYRCNLTCDHCFVWGSPRQTGLMPPERVEQIMAQASQLGTITSVYFEGGEPFLVYATLLAGAREAKRRGFSVGIVSNGFWAASPERALRTHHGRNAHHIIEAIFKAAARALREAVELDPRGSGVPSTKGVL